MRVVSKSRCLDGKKDAKNNPVVGGIEALGKSIVLIERINGLVADLVFNDDNVGWGLYEEVNLLAAGYPNLLRYCCLSVVTVMVEQGQQNIQDKWPKAVFTLRIQEECEDAGPGALVQLAACDLKVRRHWRPLAFEPPLVLEELCVVLHDRLALTCGGCAAARETAGETAGGALAPEAISRDVGTNRVFDSSSARPSADGQDDRSSPSHEFRWGPTHDRCNFANLGPRLLTVGV